jgi:hypothetical protein
MRACHCTCVRMCLCVCVCVHMHMRMYLCVCARAHAGRRTRYKPLRPLAVHNLVQSHEEDAREAEGRPPWCRRRAVREAALGFARPAAHPDSWQQQVQAKKASRDRAYSSSAAALATTIPTRLPACKPLFPRPRCILWVSSAEQVTDF